LDMVKGLLGKKEKVAQLVDKSTRCVDKCLPYKRAFADKPNGLPLQRLRYASILGVLRYVSAKRGAQSNDCLLRLSALARQGKGARFWLCALFSVYLLVESLGGFVYVEKN